MMGTIMKLSNRIPKDKLFMEMAELVSKRGTCSRLQVGCVLTNGLGHVLATGYNGVGRGLPHCTQQPCRGANIPIGQGTGTCEAIHAEQNALLQCRDVEDIHTCYVTTAPCLDCTKLFLNTGCKWIIYINQHPKMELAEELWKKAKRSMLQFGYKDLDDNKEVACDHFYNYDLVKFYWQCVHCGKVNNAKTSLPEPSCRHERVKNDVCLACGWVV